MLSATAASGFVGKLLGSGFQRLGSLVFQKVCRVRKIDFALKGQVSRNPVVQTALSDFQTVIGTFYGLLDEKLFAFLEELEKTGLITNLVENALFDRSSSAAFCEFEGLHAQFFDAGEGDAGSLYSKLTTAFSVSVRELCKDAVLLEFLQSSHNETITRLEQIDEHIRSFSSNDSIKTMSFEQLRPVLTKIARGVQANNRTVRVETTKGARQVEIGKIYIAPRLKYRENGKNADRVATAISGLEGFQKQVFSSSKLTNESSLGTLIEGEEASHFQYKDIKQQFNKVVVLGDPGGGKSTLCQNLCFDLARQANLALQAGPGRATAAQTQKVPIKVVLRLFERARAGAPQLSLKEYIIRDLPNYVNAEDEELRQALSYLLESGRAVLAFDGLDEILATSQRRDFVDLVNGFCVQYPLCPVIVTSRLVGYDNAPLGDEYEELVLEKFDSDQVKFYVKKFMMVVSGRKESEAETLSMVFYEQTTSNAADLRRNPLMLGLMAWLFEMRRDVPSNRPEIYQECAVLMFERWDPDRDIKADAPSGFDRLQLFSEIAARLFGTDEAAGVDTIWLEECTRDFLNRIYEDKARSTDAAKKLVKFVTGRAWVMSEVGDGTFAFTHQTFLEYFFARQVDADSDSVDEVFNVIKPRIANREWDVVAHLSLQIKTHRNLRRIDTAISLLLQAIKDAKSDKAELKAFISFGSRALEYLSGSESQVRMLVEEIYNHGIEQEAADALEGRRDIVHCASCANERRDFVASCLVEMVLNTFKGAELSKCITVSALITGYLWKPDAIRRRTAIGAHFPPNISNALIVSLKSELIGRSMSNIFYAIKGWEWYGHTSDELVKLYWLEMFQHAASEPYVHDGLISLALGPASDDERIKSRSLQAMKDIAVASVDALPLREEDRNSGVIQVHIQFWRDRFKFVDNHGLSAIGFIYVMLYYDTRNRGKSRGGHLISDTIIAVARQLVLETPKGRARSKLEAIIEHRSLFST